MMYLLTPEVHAQIVRIIGDASWHIPEGSPLDRDAESALAMLKAMKPVTPSGYMHEWISPMGGMAHRFEDWRHSPTGYVDPTITSIKPLYAKEQQ